MSIAYVVGHLVGRCWGRPTRRLWRRIYAHISTPVLDLYDYGFWREVKEVPMPRIHYGMFVIWLLALVVYLVTP